MLRTGSLILCIWCWINVLPAVGSLGYIVAGKHAPGLLMRFTTEEIKDIEGRALATIDGLATLFNTMIAVYCITIFMVIRKSLLNAETWSLITFGSGALVIQIIAYITDHYYFLGKNTVALHISTTMLLLGFGLCLFGFRQQSPEHSRLPS